MSISWFITTYKHKDWESPSDDFQLNPEDFFESFQKHFGMRVVSQANEHGDISWDLYTQDEQSLGFYGLVHRNMKGVSFHSPPKEIFVNFALWYRTFILAQYDLHLWNNSDPEQRLILIADTTALEIEIFIGYE